MIFSNAADDATPAFASDDIGDDTTADGIGDDATADCDAAGEDIAGGDASGSVAEAAGPLAGGAVVGSVMVFTGAGAEVGAKLEVGGVLAVLPLPPVELQPVTSTAAAATQNHIDG